MNDDYIEGLRDKVSSLRDEIEILQENYAALKEHADAMSEALKQAAKTIGHESQAQLEYETFKKN